MKLRPQYLIFEVTRRCNMACEHCLRGEAQNKDMDKETVDKVLDSVENIGILTLTGGEPTLNLELCRYIFDGIKKRNIHMEGFFVATNGKEHQMELAQLLLENIPYAESAEYCGISVSKDVFHDEVTRSPVEYLSIYRDWKEQGDYKNYTTLVSRGRAAENFAGYARQQDPIMNLGPFAADEDSICLDGDMYITADGLICADFDLAYDQQEECMVGSMDAFDQLIAKLKKEAAE